MTVLLSILLGLIPEVLFITLFLIFTKNLKNKRIILFLLIGISYIISMFIQKYKIIFYILFIVLIYLSLKFIYKKKVQIIDLFVITIPFTWITMLSFICFLFFDKNLTNYYQLYVVDRLILFIPLIFSKHYNKIYLKYCKLWNRNDNEKRPIKSITLRNISLIIVNIAIFLMNIYAMSIIKFLS